MYQIPEDLRNELAPTLQHEKNRRLFAMTDEEMEAELEKRRSKLDSSYSHKAISAHLALTPLLEENVAISRFVIEKQSPDLRMMLPELTTVDELTNVASLEYNLTPSQMTELVELVQSTLKA